MNAGTDVTINEGTSASLRGTATDPEGRVSSYTWTTGTRTFTGATVSIPFGDDGTFVVTLTACDNGSPAACASDSLQVRVLNLDPAGSIRSEPSGAHVVNTALPYARTNFAPVTFQVTASDVPADPLTYLWDFNDGSAPRTGSATISYEYPLGQFDPTVLISDGDGGTRLVRFHRITVTASGTCSGASSELIAARLFDWWGGGTTVTVSSNVLMWRLVGTEQGPVVPKYTFRAGQLTTTRGAGQGANGPMLQSGCVVGKKTGTRYIGIASPDPRYQDTYLVEDLLIKNPK